MNLPRISGIWLALALVSIVILGLRLQLNFDLSAFFPQETNLKHDVLLEQLKNGPGSRLIVIGLSGSQQDQLEIFSDRLKQELAANPAFINVLNGNFEMEAAVIPEPINSYYLLLDNLDYSEDSFQGALQSRLKDLTLGGGTTLLSLIAKDPFLQSLKVLERLVPINMSGETWFAEDGSAVLLAETKAPAIDLTAQLEAVNAVKKEFLNLSGSNSLELEITGVGAFGVELQKTIRAESKKRSILATGVLIAILLVVYRNLRLVLLAALPIGMGFLVGLTVVTLIFDSVHGITLAFGFTLMGIAIDYPLHLFSHSRQVPSETAIRGIWPTLRIGAISTAIAYLAISLSGSSGLAQLGIFTTSGVIVAVLVTRSWLPLLMDNKQGTEPEPHTKTRPPVLTFLPALLVLGAALFLTKFMVEGELWEDTLASLSPVPEQRLLADGLLRSAAGSADMRYQLVLNAPTLEELLLKNEAVDVLLEAAVEDGLLGAWQSVSQVLPSRLLQETRKNAIPDADVLHDRLMKALKETPFQQSAFDAFEANAESSKLLLPLLPAHFGDTPLASWLGSHLIQVGDQWVSLITISKPQPEPLAARIETWGPEVQLIDLHQSSRDLMHDYRLGAIKTLSIAVLVIAILLLIECRQPRRILWIVLTVMAAISMTVGIVTIFHAGLTIIHLVALILVLGLGLDYTLFLSRTETKQEQQTTRHAVIACAITTTLTFSILAGSSIPVLKFLGLTVATGSAASFILAFAGSWLQRRSVEPTSQAA